MHERQTTYPKEKLLPESTDIVIVGAGLSGKTLAASLPSDSSFILIDSKAPSAPKEVMYLVTNNVAKAWGIDDKDLSRRNRITGSIYLRTSGEIASEFRTSGLSGFATIPQTFMEKQVNVGEENLYFQTKCLAVERSEGHQGVIVHTNNGTIQAQIVIDATGWQGNIMHQYYGEEDFTMAAVYGGNYKTAGFDPSALYMVRGLESNNKNWVMPISKNGAEVVATQQIRRSETNRWRENYAKSQFDQLVDWYREQGYVIYNNKEGKHMGFRLEPAKKKYFDGHVVPFGESAGLNSPYIGQLIDTLPFYVRKMAAILTQAKKQNTWELVGKEFYSVFLTDPPYAYLLHSVLRDNSIKLQNGYPEINKILIDILKEDFSEDELWSILNDNGIGTRELQIIAKNHPIRLAQFVVSSIPSLASILVRNPELYEQFFRRMIKNFKKKTRMQIDELN